VAKERTRPETLKRPKKTRDAEEAKGAQEITETKSGTPGKNPNAPLHAKQNNRPNQKPDRTQT
jgi:hypothetical protein